MVPLASVVATLVVTQANHLEHWSQIPRPIEWDGLVASLDRNSKGGPSALASLTATSRQPEDCTGRSDKTPVLTQNLPNEERFPMCAVLSWPREHFCSTHQEPDHNSGGRVATVSLRRDRLPVVAPPRSYGVPSDQWSQYSTDVQKGQGVFFLHKGGRW